MAKSRRDRLAESLTVQQQKAAYLLLENEMLPTKEQRTLEQIAEEIGVTRNGLYNWRTQNQAFIEFKKEVAKDYLSDAVGIFTKQLIRSMEGTNGVPSSKALDLYAKMMGFIKTEHSVEITQGGAKSDAQIAEELKQLDALLAQESEQK